MAYYLGRSRWSKKALRGCSSYRLAPRHCDSNQRTEKPPNQPSGGFVPVHFTFREVGRVLLDRTLLWARENLERHFGSVFATGDAECGGT